MQSCGSGVILLKNILTERYLSIHILRNLKIKFMNKLLKVLLLILLSSNLIYCQKNDLKDFINKGVIGGDNIINDSKVNLFDSLKKYEIFLIESKLLNGITLSNYSHLVGKNFGFKELKKIIKITEFEFPFIHDLNSETSNWLTIYNVCPSQVFKNSNKLESNYLSSLKIVYDRINAEGYPSKSILEEVLLKTNFDDETTRLMMCNLIYINWLTLYRNEVYKNKKNTKD